MAVGRTNVDMTEGVIWRQIMRFALPMLLGQFFQQLYNTVDVVVVGRFVGSEALAAVGATGTIVNALLGFFGGLGAGAGVVISQLFGARDERGMSEAVHTTALLTLLFSAVATAGGLLIAPHALRWMNTPDDVMADALEYLTIFFAGTSGLMVYNIGAGVLRAIGDSRRPLYFLVFSALLNLGLDLIFVCLLGWGVAGVAIATVVSQGISAVLVVRVLMRMPGPCRLRPREMRMSRAIAARVMKLGLPTALQNGVTSLSNVFVQAYINAFGAKCMAGWTSYSRLDAFAWLPMMCLGMASTTFVGQNLGAGQAARAKEGVRVSLRLSLTATACIVAPLMLFARPLLQMVNSDPKVLEYGIPFILYMSPFYIPYSYTQIYTGALRGGGDSLSPMIITLSSFVLFRWLYLIIGTRFVHSALYVAMGYPAGWVVSAVAAVMVYRRADFEKFARRIRSARQQQPAAQGR